MPRYTTTPRRPQRRFLSTNFPPPDDFTGREAELAELRAALETRGATISGLHGMGGVGKTVLALKLAEELTPLYPSFHQL